MYICEYVCVCVCMYVCVCVYVGMYVCTYVRMYVCVWVYVCVYACTYVCMYVCMCVCIRCMSVYTYECQWYVCVCLLCACKDLWLVLFVHVHIHVCNNGFISTYLTLISPPYPQTALWHCFPQVFTSFLGLTISEVLISGRLSLGEVTANKAV